MLVTPTINATNTATNYKLPQVCMHREKHNFHGSSSTEWVRVFARVGYQHACMRTNPSSSAPALLTLKRASKKSRVPVMTTSNGSNVTNAIDTCKLPQVCMRLEKHSFHGSYSAEWSACVCQGRLPTHMHARMSGLRVSSSV